MPKLQEYLLLLLPTGKNPVEMASFIHFFDTLMTAFEEDS